MRFSLARQRGFTLVEVVTAILIGGIVLGVFYFILYTNVSAYEERIALADISQEANTIIDQMTSDGRLASRFVLTQENQSKNVKMYDRTDGLLIDFTIFADGRFQMQRANQIPVILSRQLLFADSGFAIQGRSLMVTLVLRDKVFMRNVTFSASSEIWPRN